MRSLASFQNIYNGSTIIVCGCGESLNDLEDPQRFITIGVNDVGRLFQPNYLVVLNPRRQFTGDRFNFVENSQAEYLFTQLDLRISHPNIVRIRLGKFGGTDLNDPHVLHYTQNSPYVAVCLAAHMGATRIGIIGVDFTDNHFFSKTGQHALNRHFTKIDSEYKALNEALASKGIEVSNLSSQSRLTAFKKIKLEEFCKLNSTSIVTINNYQKTNRRIFFVNYKFLSCGEVFADGLAHAAADIGLEYDSAYWDDPGLPEKISQFNPDLLFVVHGRKFSQRWGNRFSKYNSAVWLLDEPYEVDDTCKYSSDFDTVFVNDRNSIDRHQNAFYLPVGFDPYIYNPAMETKKYDVGFIGGHNPTRQRVLETLRRDGLLSYVIGGPWKGNLNRICLSKNIPAEETAQYYKETRIVVNVFREVHHFNKQKIPVFSLNPRIYEALACGAVVVSESREEINKVFPDMPVFKNSEQLVKIIKELLDDNNKYEAVQKKCFDYLKEHTYTERLKKIISLAFADKNYETHAPANRIKIQTTESKIDEQISQSSMYTHPDWEDYGQVIERADNEIIVLRKAMDLGPGTERGLVSKKMYSGVDLSFEVNIESGSCFVAKINQVDQHEQLTNSYHLMCDDSRNYFARHFHVFNHISINRNTWQKIRITYLNGTISFYRGETLVFSIKDDMLKNGYAFLGVKGGVAQLREITIKDLKPVLAENMLDSMTDKMEYRVIHYGGNGKIPVVSIITTVYDRVECLRSCIRSVKRQHFQNYEHIIVADCPPDGILEKLHQTIEAEDNGKIKFVNLTRRYNNWGIKPASVGIGLSRGKYVCFLSDDNGYLPEHLGMLINELERQPELGFVYSSCQYDGRRILNSSVPAPARIDLGQPMFRRELFKLHFQDNLPYNLFAWDWHMIEHYMKQGVRWKHINQPTFLFRLNKYPQYCPQ